MRCERCRKPLEAHALGAPLLCAPCALEVKAEANAEAIPVEVIERLHERCSKCGRDYGDHSFLNARCPLSDGRGFTAETFERAEVRA